MARTAAILSLFLVVSPAAAAIRGRVVGAGHPVANATVRAYAVETMPETLTRVVANRPRAALATTQSAADGTFTLPVEGNGAVVVNVVAAGFVSSSSEEALGDADVLIALATKHSREIALRSANGPLAGARAVAFLPVGLVETTADDRGKLTIDHDGPALVFIAHPRSVPYMALLQQHDDVVDVEAGAPLKGSVVDAAGKGVANAKVFLNFVPAAVSGADGSFTIERAPQHYEQLSAEAGDLGGSVGAGITVIRVAPRVAVSGVVRDEEKRPLRGVSLALWSTASGVVYAVSDEKGAFAIRAAPGAYQFGSTSTLYHLEQTPLDVRKAVVKDVVVTRTPMITGVVKKRDGTPVDGAEIALAIEMTGDSAAIFDHVAQEAGFPHSTTGPDGRFRMMTFAIGQAYSVVAYKRGLPPGQSALVKSGTPPREMSIVLDETAEEVGGVVRDAAAQPVAGVAVVALPPDRVVFGTFDEPPRTDAAGRFSIRLPKGVWHMTFAKDGYLKQDLTRVEVPPVKPMAVTLTQSSSIRGRVVRASGAGVAGVMVMVGEINVVTTSEDGSFTLDGVPPGERLLRYMTPSHTYGEQRVTAPASDVRIVLADGGTVRGRVVDPAGAPVTAYEITVSRLSEKAFFPREVADPDGRFVVDDAPAGEVVVVVKAKGFATTSQHVVVEAGKTADEIVVTLSRGRRVHGKVVSAAGEPLAEVKISMNRSEESGVTNADGTFEVNGLGTEPVWLSFAKSGFATHTQQVRAGDGDANLDVQLRPGLKLTGHVLAPGGEPLPSAEVTASAPGQEMDFATATTNEKGEFAFESLAAGRYSLEVGNQMAEAPEGRLDGVDIEYVHDVTIRTKMPVYGTIYGEVAGSDLAGREISVSAISDGRFVQANADSAGKYRIDKAPVGTVRLRASVDVAGTTRWSRTAVVEVAPRGEVRADLRFADTFPISGRVLRSGQPMPGATVIFEGDDSNEIKAATGEGGAYRTALAAGHYTITVGGYSIQHDVAGPETIDLKLDVTRISVTVVDAATSEPLADATINARDSTSSTHATITASTGTSGVAAFDIPRNISNLVVSKDGYGTVAVAVSAGTPSLVVKLTRGEGATVRVVDARDGHPLSGYAIARDAGGRVLASVNEFAPDGTAHLPLPAGHYRFSASASEYGSHTVAADVPGADVLIPLRPGGKLLLQSQADVRADARLIEPGGEEYVRCWCNGIADIRINGRSTLVDSIAPGSYTLEVMQAGKKPRTIPVTVIQGQTVTVSLDP